MSDTLPDNVHWFHGIDLGDGLLTPGFKDNNLLRAEANVVFSYPVAGKTVLDIGAWDGFFSFEAERRGASRVLATDWYCWSGPGWGTQAGFNHARRVLKSNVEDQEINVPDISPETVGIFDVVIMSGVLYHVTDPLMILKKAADVTRECLIIETAVALVDVADPAMQFLNAMPHNGDPTNFWSPNPAAVIAMLKWCGFKNVMTSEHPHNKLSDPNNPRCYFHAVK
jgi:tRNA (mo5U34)-methyltransferase